jgi:hypothetical protein
MNEGISVMADFTLLENHPEESQQQSENRRKVNDVSSNLLYISGKVFFRFCMSEVYPNGHQYV